METEILSLFPPGENRFATRMYFHSPSMNKTHLLWNIHEYTAVSHSYYTTNSDICRYSLRERIFCNKAALLPTSREPGAQLVNILAWRKVIMLWMHPPTEKSTRFLFQLKYLPINRGTEDKVEKTKTVTTLVATASNSVTTIAVTIETRLFV